MTGLPPQFLVDRLSDRVGDNTWASDAGGAEAPRPQERGRDAGTYSHLWPDTEDGTRDAVDMVLGRVQPESSTLDASTR